MGWRAFLIWMLIAGLEVIQGIGRVLFFNRVLGDRRARQLGVVIGSLTVLVAAWATLPWLGARGFRDLLAVGTLWLVLMLGLDLAFGRLVFRMPWDRIARDFDLRRGGWLALGMVVVWWAPLIAAKLRGLI
jgi:hypothetical protein